MRGCVEQPPLTQPLPRVQGRGAAMTNSRVRMTCTKYEKCCQFPGLFCEQMKSVGQAFLPVTATRLARRRLDILVQSIGSWITIRRDRHECLPHPFKRTKRLPTESSSAGFSRTRFVLKKHPHEVQKNDRRKRAGTFRFRFENLLIVTWLSDHTEQFVRAKVALTRSRFSPLFLIPNSTQNIY